MKGMTRPANQLATKPNTNGKRGSSDKSATVNLKHVYRKGMRSRWHHVEIPVRLKGVSRLPQERSISSQCSAGGPHDHTQRNEIGLNQLGGALLELGPSSRKTPWPRMCLCRLGRHCYKPCPT